jgi:alpha/beta superfamily hydrolase
MPLLSEPDRPIVVERVCYPAGQFLLEGELVYPETEAPRGVAVLAGPHPLLGGDLRNNVVRGVGDGLAARGIVALRFNYRGVGGSEGTPADVARHLAAFWQTSHVPDEMDLCHDVHGAIDFARRAAGSDLSLALIGYSFGCALLPHALSDETSPALVLIAPTLDKHDYSPYFSVNLPVLGIASEDDFATPAGRIREWFGRLPGPARLLLQKLDNHFFRGNEAWLAGVIGDFLEEQWKDGP